MDDLLLGSLLGSIDFKELLSIHRLVKMVALDDGRQFPVSSPQDVQITASDTDPIVLSIEIVFEATYKSGKFLNAFVAMFSGSILYASWWLILVLIDHALSHKANSINYCME